MPASPDPPEDPAALRLRLAALEAENALLHRSLAAPLGRLAALDAALVEGDAALAGRIEAMLRVKLLADLPDTRFLAMLCIANDLLAAAYRLLQPMLATAEPDPAVLRLAGRLADGLGEPERAWAHYADPAAMLKPNGEVARLALRLGHRDWLAAALARPGAGPRILSLAPFLGLPAGPPAGATLPVLVVNLPTDRHRRRRSARNLAGFGIAPRFRRGWRPLEIPAEDRRLFRGVTFDIATDGSFGNQYAQYLLWREIAAGDDVPAVVLEDDSLLLAHPASVLAGLALPAEWDVIFANPRLELPPPAGAAPGGFTLTPFAEAFIAHSHRTPDRRGYGNDCLILSRRGARKLLAIVEEEGFHTVGTDWYLQSHCMPPDCLDALHPESTVRLALGNRFGRRVFSRIRLDAHVLSPALTQNLPLGVSRGSRI